MTRDIDIVIEVEEEDAGTLFSLFSTDFYVNYFMGVVMICVLLSIVLWTGYLSAISSNRFFCSSEREPSEIFGMEFKKNISL